MQNYLVFYKWNNRVKLLIEMANNPEEIYQRITDVEIVKIYPEPYPNNAGFMRLRSEFIINTARELEAELINKEEVPCKH